MQSDLQHEKYETLIRVINEGHDETVKDSKSTPMGNVKGGEYQSPDMQTKDLNVTFFSVLSGTCSSAL